jgi:phenylpropionate dioxygenase-like ring-hydroxylating dioxygenase large terminal subunit
MAMSTERLRALVRPGRVHRSLYSDPEIFALEMERIFGRAWVYVGHESEVPAPGDFIATRIGLKPLLMVRHRDGTVRVLHNQCAHRGAMVVAAERGHADAFRCCYHGWTYDTDGRLKSAPLLNAYPPAFDPGDPALAMLPVARAESYRGFVFASLAADGPDLAAHLGAMTASFDDMVDRAPDGAIEVAGGVLKHAYNGNWKLYLENLCDAAHPLFVHQSSIEAASAQSDAAATDGAGEVAIRQMRQNGAPYSFWETQVGIWTCGNGHSYLGDYHDDAKLVAALEDPVFRDYIAALEAKRGRARAQEILAVRRWNTNVYPNLSFMSQFQQLRVVHPVAPGRTVVYTYNFRLAGAPPSLFRRTIAFANVVNGTGSPVLTDDLETYDRIGFGLASEGAPWLQIGRGFTTDTEDGGGIRRGHNATSEIYIRNMFDAWLGYMTQDAP